MALHKPWPYMGSLALHIYGITAQMRDAIKIEIPTGYQDETGFHLGVETTQRKKSKWPPEG